MSARLRWGSPGQATAVVVDVGARRVDVVTDPTVLALAPVRQFVEGLSGATDVTVFPDAVGSLETLSRRVGEFRGDTLVAVGGGSVIDAAKLLRYLRAAGPGRLGTPQRCGLRVVTPLGTDAPRLVAVPTTVGTGAEASSGAVVQVGGRPILVRGLAMVPDATWYCADIFAALPAAIQARGAVEVLFRLMAPALEARGEERLPELLPSARAVLRSGEDIVAGRGVPAAMATILEVGVQTHGSSVHRGLHPFGSRIWYVANEATATLGVPKLDVLPPLWLAALHLGATGGLDWTPAGRLSRVQSALGLDAEGPGLAGALAATFRRWGVPTRLELGGTPVGPLADTCLWRWGLGLPMLRRVERPELVSLLTTASAAPWSSSSEEVHARVEHGRR